MNSDSDRKDWIDSLKVGDLVANTVFDKWYLFKVEELGKTKKARIRVNKSWYDETGNRRVDSWHHDSIDPITPEIKEAVKRRRTLEALNKIEWAKLDTDTLVKVLVLVAPKSE